MLKSYGIISATDAQAVADALDEVVRRFPNQKLRVCEIGICHGDTSRGIAQHLADQGVEFEYWGVDNDRDGAAGAVCAKQPPFEGANVVNGESEYVYMKVPGPLQFLFVDGGHDITHVMLDALHYGDKVEKGGLMLFHDVSPRAQNKMDWQGSGPKDHVDFGTATREALRKLGLFPELRSDWRLVAMAIDEALDWGGIAVFEKL